MTKNILLFANHAFTTAMGLLLICLATGCVTTSANYPNERWVNHLNAVLREAIIYNDEHKSGPPYPISERLMSLAMECCDSNADMVVALFQQSGFRVTNRVQDCKRTEFGESANQAKKVLNECVTGRRLVEVGPNPSGYEDMFIAEKRENIMPFIGYTAYQAFIPVKDGRVQKISTSVGQDSL